MQAVQHCARVRAGVLDVAYLRSRPGRRPAGAAACTAFPTTSTAYVEVAPMLAAAGCRVIVPYLRGYGATRFVERRDAALGRAGGARRRPAGAARCAGDPARGAGRLRLGRPRGLRGGGAVARALRGAGLAQQLQHPEHREGDAAGRAGERAAATGTSTTFTASAAAPGSRRTGARIAQAAVAAVVADLAVRRRHLRAQRRRLRPSGFRRRGDPLLPPSLRAGAGRPGLCRHRGAPRRAAAPSPCRRITFDGADDGVLPVAGTRRRMRTASPARARTASCPAPATTCRRKSRGSSPMRCSNSCMRNSRHDRHA